MFDLKTFGKIPTAVERALFRKRSSYYRNKGFAWMGTKPSADIGFQIAREYAKSSRKSRMPQIEIPVIFHSKKDWSETPSQPFQMMWLGHASLLIEMAGKRLLIDPVFANRPSPTQLAGPSKRFHPAPFSITNLPHVDFILITHNHYDHLDYDFIKAVNHLDIHFIIPLGLGATLRYWGIPSHQITEINWHETVEFENLQFTAVDAKHYSGRGFNDRNASFWNAYIIQTKQQKIFISGDSGYIEAYKDIGVNYGPFDIAAIAIGAYHKLWPDNHKTPEEAWQAKQDIKAQKMLPIHWATFDLAIHSWDEPIERLVKIADKQMNELLLPKVGDWVKLNKEQDFEFWWR